MFSARIVRDKLSLARIAEMQPKQMSKFTKRELHEAAQVHEPLTLDAAQRLLDNAKVDDDIIGAIARQSGGNTLVVRHRKSLIWRLLELLAGSFKVIVYSVAAIFWVALLVINRGAKKGIVVNIRVPWPVDGIFPRMIETEYAILHYHHVKEQLPKLLEQIEQYEQDPDAHYASAINNAKLGDKFAVIVFDDSGELSLRAGICTARFIDGCILIETIDSRGEVRTEVHSSGSGVAHSSGSGVAHSSGSGVAQSATPFVLAIEIPRH